MDKKLLIITINLFFILSSACQFSYAADTVASKTTDTKAPTAKTQTAAKTSGVMALGGTGGDITSGSVGQGASLSPLLSESFQTDLATGSATANIPIVVPPGRKNMQPSLAISYSSNNSNGVCGVGWGLTASSIQRSTKKGIPKYDNTDTFDFASSGSIGDLVLIDAPNNEYRQKIETGFMKYVFDNSNYKWTVWDKAGTKYTFGSSTDSRIINSDGTKTFAWFLDRVTDVYGNTVIFTYTKDNGQIYLSKVNYTANAVVTPALTADKEIDFIYETGRPDITYSNRTGWQIATVQRLKETQIKVDGALVWRYALTYLLSGDTNRSLLSQITLFDAAGNSLPPKKFTYQTIE
jgi:hypothetical protein